MDRLTIGQMAKINHISQQTLRLYDRIGLLKPHSTGDENRYRYYDIRQNARLDMIQYMKSLGMGLREIKELLDRQDVSDIKRVLMQKNAALDRQIDELRLQKRAVERAMDSYDRYETAPPDGAIVAEYIPRRLVYCFDAGINFYDHGSDVYEEILRRLKESLLSDSLPQIYYCNVGTILRRENLEQRRFISTEFFVFVDPEYVRRELTTTIEPGMYLCIYCDRFAKEKEYALRLLDHAAQNGYTLAGDYLCEVLTDLPVFEGNERGMFLRLQVPIRFR